MLKKITRIIVLVVGLIGLFVLPNSSWAALKPHSIKILSVPFTVQAPQANWSAPYGETCEEAAMLMAAEYLVGQRKGKLDAVYANREILKLVQWQEKNRGFYEDTTVAEVVDILKDYYSIQADVMPYDIINLKQAIDNKQVVLLPTAGRQLGNPYFRRPGPLYHMLIVRGYQGDEIITNDPGTKRGENYRYQIKVLNEAVHDWNSGEVDNGQQVMIVVKGFIKKK